MPFWHNESSGCLKYLFNAFFLVQEGVGGV